MIKQEIAGYGDVVVTVAIVDEEAPDVGKPWRIRLPLGVRLAAAEGLAEMAAREDDYWREWRAERHQAQTQRQPGSSGDYLTVAKLRQLRDGISWSARGADL